MPLYIPGTSDLYESGLDNLIQAMLNRNAVISGCQVVERSPTIMGVRVGAGTIQGANIRVTVGQTDLAVAANGSASPRVDLVSINFTTGVATITAGTPAATPKPPVLAASDILVGYVTVVGGAVQILNANISDRRLFLPSAYEDLAGLEGRPNLFLNSDYGRRTATQTVMGERFLDGNGQNNIGTVGAPTIGSNILTSSVANAEYQWPALSGGAFTWRDGRASATFKAVLANGSYSLRWRIDASNRVNVLQEAGVFYIQKLIAGANTNIVNVATVLTVNRWYWLEIEKQGTTIIGRIYDTSGTTPGVAKASSTLLQTLVTTVADASVQTGASISFASDQAALQLGGLNTGDGGVYVEAINNWPESHPVSFDTMGGAAVGIDESTDAGPIGKQAVLRVYIPPSTTNVRRVIVAQDSATGTAEPSTAYTESVYMKVSGKTGSGTLIQVQTWDDAFGSVIGGGLPDAGEIAWTRKTTSGNTASTQRKFWKYAYFNPNLTVSLGGTAYIALRQIEKGSTATAWRNAPADDAPIVWEFLRAAADTATTVVEINSRDLAVNFFLPWDAYVVTEVDSDLQNTGLNISQVQVRVDGTNVVNRAIAHPVINQSMPLHYSVRWSLAAGKHRAAVWAGATAGTTTLDGANYATIFRVTAYRGK